MSSLAEIESAADALPRSEQELLLGHLQAKLQRVPVPHSESAAVAPEQVEWPDYESRLRAIYENQSMPSMVLAEREAASW